MQNARQLTSTCDVALLADTAWKLSDVHPDKYLAAQHASSYVTSRAPADLAGRRSGQRKYSYRYSLQQTSPTCSLNEHVAL